MLKVKMQLSNVQVKDSVPHDVVFSQRKMKKHKVVNVGTIVTKYNIGLTNRELFETKRARRVARLEATMKAVKEAEEKAEADHKKAIEDREKLEEELAKAAAEEDEEEEEEEEENDEAVGLAQPPVGSNITPV